MAGHSTHGGATAGTVGGTLVTVIANIQSADVIHTAVLATIGATVSFVISVVLKKVWRKFAGD